MRGATGADAQASVARPGKSPSRADGDLLLSQRPLVRTADVLYSTSTPLPAAAGPRARTGQMAKCRVAGARGTIWGRTHGGKAVSRAAPERPERRISTEAVVFGAEQLDGWNQVLLGGRCIPNSQVT